MAAPLSHRCPPTPQVSPTFQSIPPGSLSSNPLLCSALPSRELNGPLTVTLKDVLLAPSPQHSVLPGLCRLGKAIKGGVLAGHCRKGLLSLGGVTTAQ